MPTSHGLTSPPSGGERATQPHPLDNPAYASLTGPHAHFAERRGNALRYQVDVAPFPALPSSPDDVDWADLGVLAGPGAIVPLAGIAVPPPDRWEIVSRGDGVQLVDDAVAARPDHEATRLGSADVPDMLDLVGRTKPGPFLPRTIELGTYLGIRSGGRLVAMAGERLHPPGWTEISAVCTDKTFRGQGLATRLVLAVAAGIRERGETPFLHAAADNRDAIRLYLSLGFRLRCTMMFTAARVPSPESIPAVVAVPRAPTG
jgi:ribosomal protein S18 acetylase RimI-like enzyme